MITSLQFKDDWYIINDAVRIKFSDDLTSYDAEFDDKILTEDEVKELVNELLQDILNFYKNEYKG
jgi:hypothetical protein